MDLAISLDGASDTPLYQQLAEALRRSVLQKRLKPNQKLPPSRALAKSLEISRTTVTQSYDILLSEGYFEARRGAGTFVSPRLPEEYLQIDRVAQKMLEQPGPMRLSRFGAGLQAAGLQATAEPGGDISFRYGSPAAEHFPMALWRRLLARHCQSTAALLNYSADAAGHMPLRKAIADYLGRSRAVQCCAAQVIIVSGSQQALELIARLTLDRGDWVAMENPGYQGARRCFQGQGANLQGIPVDAEGIDVKALRQCPQAFKLLYVTPSHQFPTGAILPLSRRLSLLQWAQQAGTLILEDDYDSEYRYGGRPVPALQGLDQANTVLYVGTFSKVLFPSLRIGYLVVPTAWVPLVSQAKWLCDRYSPLLEQYALTDFMVEGHFEAHIRRMRHRYDQRRQALVDALSHHLGSRATVLGENAGIHLMAQIKTDLPDDAVIRRAQRLGVGLTSARGYYVTAPKRGEFIFGYTELDESQIEEGIRRLSRVLTA
ncbi:MAG: PLP-dependent aminotransferase family protein [Elainellaceae cyanobacterium]